MKEGGRQLAEIRLLHVCLHPCMRPALTANPVRISPIHWFVNIKSCSGATHSCTAPWLPRKWKPRLRLRHQPPRTLLPPLPLQHWRLKTMPLNLPLQHRHPKLLPLPRPPAHVA